MFNSTTWGLHSSFYLVWFMLIDTLTLSGIIGLGRTDPPIAPIGGNVNKNLPLFLSLLIRN
jgi:hypothetical protein